MKKLTILFILLCMFSCENESIVLEQTLQPCEDIFVGNVTLASQAEVDEFAVLGYCGIDGNLTIGAEHNVFIDSDITDISELNSLKNIRDTLNIKYNPGLSNLTGLDNLESFSVLKLYRNINLLNINAFGNLNGQVSSITVSENSNLTDLAGLDNITVILEQLNILGNENLESLEGLENLRTIGSLFLSLNANLNSAINLQSSIITESLIIQGCNFTSLEGINVSDQLDVLALNLSGTITSIEALSNLTEVGSLVINEMHGLDSLQGLDNLTSVNDLSISQNDNLISLTGLNSLESANSIHITRNNSLASLSGLENLNTVSEILSIGVPDFNSNNDYGNGVLSNYCALENLFSNGTYGEIIIEDNTFNPTLQDIINGDCEATPCNNGTYVGNVELNTQQEVDDFGAMCYSKIEGYLLIGYDAPLQQESDISSLSSLAGLNEITDALGIMSNPLLTDLRGLESLQSISNVLSIYKCNSLISVEALQNLTSSTVLERLIIADNDSLINLEGLDGVDVAGLGIYDNDALINLNGLQGFEIIERLTIQDNENLISLNGLNNLNIINDRLTITSNENITSLNGLESLIQCNFIEIGSYNAVDYPNPQLSDFCALTNLFINGTYGEVTIDNNAYNPAVQDIIDGNCAQ